MVLGKGLEVDSLASILGHKVRLKYFGLLLRAKFRNTTLWDVVRPRFEKIVATWKRNFFSKQGNLTPLKILCLILTFINYSCSLFLFSIAKKLENFQCCFYGTFLTIRESSTLWLRNLSSFPFDRVDSPVDLLFLSTKCRKRNGFGDLCLLKVAFDGLSLGLRLVLSTWVESQNSRDSYTMG